MANKYTKSDIITEVIARQKKQGYSKEELNELRNKLKLDLDKESVNMINGLAQSKGGIYAGFNYFRQAQKNGRSSSVVRSDVTPEQVQARVFRATGKRISVADATRKSTRENSTNKIVAHWENALAYSIPTNAVLGILAKVGVKVLPKLLANPVIRNSISKAAEQGVKIPNQLVKATKALANKVDKTLPNIKYQATGRLPAAKGPQENINADMARIASGMDRIQARSTIPAGPASKIPASLSDDIQMAAGKIMSAPHAGPSNPNMPGFKFRDPRGGFRPREYRDIAEGPAISPEGAAIRRTSAPVQESSVGGVTPLMGQRADALAKLGSRGRNPPMSADPRLATQSSQYGYGRDKYGRMLPHMRASGPRRVEASGWPGPAAGARVSPTVSPHPKYAGRPPTASPHPGPNIPRTALAAALGTALFDNLDSNQKAVLEEAKKIEAEQIRAYDSEEETNWWEGYTEPSDSTDSTDGQIAEPAFGRMLGLRRSAEEIERDVAITEALDAGNYDRVAELEKQYGSAPVEDSLTYRTKDYTPEEIDAALAQDSGSVLEDLQSLIGDIEHGTDSDSDLIAGANYNSGGTVAKKPRKKKKKANSGSSKSYTTQPRKPSRA